MVPCNSVALPLRSADNVHPQLMLPCAGNVAKLLPPARFHFISGVAQWLACWAHNPKVRGSKPRSAILCIVYFCHLNANRTKTETEASRQSAKRCDSKTHGGQNTHRGARTHDHKVKGLALYRLSQAGLATQARTWFVGIISYCLLVPQASPPAM